MNDRDCESCKKFSRVDPYESEGYCEAKRTWVDPQEGEDCKMHEFTLWTADKYKDGTPIMSDSKVDINSSYPESKTAKNSMYGKVAEQSNQLDNEVPKGFHRTPFGLMPDCLFHPDNEYLKEDASREQIIEFANATADNVEQLKDFIYNDEDPEGYSHYKLVKETAQRVFNLNIKIENYVEEYDAVLKTHGDTLEEHMERITINERNIDILCCEMKDLQRKAYQIYQFLNSVDPDFFAKIQDEMVHNGPYFCGNCTHCDHGKQGDDTVYVCDLSAKIIDPDDSSCVMFELPF